MSRRDLRSERCAALELADQIDRRRLADRYPRMPRQRPPLVPRRPGAWLPLAAVALLLLLP